MQVMRILMLSWEYPPVVVGGLGRHVRALAVEMVEQGHEVVVLARREAGTDASTHPSTDEHVEGVRVISVAEDPPHLEFERDLVAWTLGMGHALARAGARLLRSWLPEVVHGHDWLVAHPAIALAEMCDAPLVATVHATEAGRHAGWLSHPLNRQVHSVEWWLANRADAVIACSTAMRGELSHLFELDPSDVHVLHNGIEPDRWQVPRRGVRQARAEHAPEGAPLLLFFGRLEHEKGAQDLLTALPRIRRSHPGTRLVVAGDGRHFPALLEQARKLRVRRAVDFTGHLGDRALRALLAAAEATVMPSRYEPFGIAALEAAAAGAPLVASTAGGLGEIVVEGKTGLSFAPGDAAGLASAVRRVLDDPRGAARRARAARARLAADFDWGRIAAQTVGVYGHASRREHGELARPKIASGNAFLR
jgi:glycogen(starch) synthase